MRCFCRVEYNGAAYSGWQVQKNRVSIQSELEDAFSTITRIPCKITGAGRTDAGVHAKGQGMHIDLPDQIDLRKCMSSVNAILPDDIAIYDLQIVDDLFHARFSATERLYKYYIVTRKRPLLKELTFFYSMSVDWERVNSNVSYLTGEHDFTAFCASGSGSDNNICIVKNTELEKVNDIFVFSICANRFVYKMVRSIVGTLLSIGREKTELTMREIIDKRDKKFAGETAPAHGLTLEYVKYAEVK